MHHSPASGADPFLDRLVRRLDPHAAASPRAEPIICGRWLLLRRLVSGLAPEALAARAGLAPEAVLLLEAGIADDALAPEAAWARLAAVLAAGCHDLPQVRAVLRVALRGATPADRGALARVRADLRAAYAGEQPPPPAPLRAAWRTFRKWLGKALPANGLAEAGVVDLTITDAAEATAVTLRDIPAPHVRPSSWRAAFVGARRLSASLVACVAGYLDASPSPVPDAPPPPAPPQPAERAEGDEALRAYCARALRELERPGLSAGLAPLPLHADGRPVVLRREARAASGGARGAGEIVSVLARPEQVEEAVLGAPRLVLLGEAGGGKSESLRALALRLLRHTLDPSAPLPAGWSAPTVPILCSLPQLAQALGSGEIQGRDVLGRLLQSLHVGGVAARLRQLAEEGKALLLLDGLDNVPAAPGRAGPRARVLAGLRALGRSLPLATRIVVTCRTAGYLALSEGDDAPLPADEGWEARTIRPLSQAAIGAAVDRLRASAPRERDGAARLARLQDDARRLGESPLLLALLLALRDDAGDHDTFSGRAALYEAYVARRLPALARAAGQGGAPRQALERAAFEQHNQPLAPALAGAAPPLDLGAPSLSEFMAACHLAGERELVSLAYRRWQSADGERWRNVLLLLAERIQQRGQLPERGLAWLNALLAETTPDSAHKAPAQRRRDVLLAAASYGAWAAAPSFDEHLAPAARARVERRLAHGLVALLAAASGAGSADRVLAGIALATLFDPRPGVASLPPEWRTVAARGAAGTVFRIARYPVTNAQWRLFLDDGGYANGAWWGEHWTLCGEQGWAQPRFWDDAELGRANQPVVGVSWYEAQAFCEWLTRQGWSQGWLEAGFRVRLPTPSEWVRAAYGDAIQRPADDVESPAGGLGERRCPRPVGCLPADSPYGACDMLDNVAEWLAAIGYAHQSSCGAHHPLTRGNLLGLRVVIAPSAPTKPSPPRENPLY